MRLHAILYVDVEGEDDNDDLYYTLFVSLKLRGRRLRS